MIRTIVSTPPKRGELHTLRRIWQELLCATIGHKWCEPPEVRIWMPVDSGGLIVNNRQSHQTQSCERCRICCDTYPRGES